jgi:hypothetical protein
LINYCRVWSFLPSNESELRTVYLDEETSRLDSCYRPVLLSHLLEPSSLAVRKYDAYPSPPVACSGFCSFSNGRFICTGKHQTFSCLIEISIWWFLWSAGNLKEFCGLRRGNDVCLLFKTGGSLCLMLLVCQNGSKSVLRCAAVMHTVLFRTYTRTRKFPLLCPRVLLRLASFFKDDISLKHYRELCLGEFRHLICMCSLRQLYGDCAFI